jgi:hypothetical protein
MAQRISQSTSLPVQNGTAAPAGPKSGGAHRSFWSSTLLAIGAIASAAVAYHDLPQAGL